MFLPRLTATNSTLLVIDVQEKLLPKMPDVPALLRDIGFLLDVANLLSIPIAVTEQYPQGLGPTHPEIVRRLPKERRSKMAFSCCGAPGLLSELQNSNRPNIVLAGMETHVCVMQTALDLLSAGLTVFLPVNALSARYAIDHNTALHRVEKSGCIPTTVETIAFEWLGTADHPQFKAVSKLIQNRMATVSS
jgi:nicotinamidase-related amidase